MRKYRILQYETHVQGYIVEAATEAEAIAAVLNGEVECADSDLEYVEVNEDLGLSLEEVDEEVIEALAEAGVGLTELFIPSIQSVSLIPQDAVSP